ncbi:myosin light chain kinase 2, skeletal/cardiac muscle-like [Phyllostomus discolor]|uniref:non-specific serine/threonine protein kinase n=1 Tax=Phyllostomus discolor TaxID=89673 RepID=A0A6J2MYU6_9CHIR|nr:myosin light chain kinase 2, skeletal/cardiac muscle-like [Phyllostomus discolor]
MTPLAGSYQKADSNVEPKDGNMVPGVQESGLTDAKRTPKVCGRRRPRPTRPASPVSNFGQPRGPGRPFPERDRAGPSSPPGAAAEGTGRKGAADLTALSPGRGRGRRDRNPDGWVYSQGGGRGAAAGAALWRRDPRPRAPGPRPSPAADPAAEQALRSPGRTRRSRRFQNLPRRRPARSAPPPPAAPPPAAAGPARLSRRHVPTSRPRAGPAPGSEPGEPRTRVATACDPAGRRGQARAGSGRQGARERGAGPRARREPGAGREPAARPSCRPPPAARTPRPPPFARLPPVGFAPPSVPAPGGCRRAPDLTPAFVLYGERPWGSFAEVKLAWHSLTGTKVALKSLSQWDSTREFEEMKSLKTLHHPNVIALFEVITTRDKHILFMEHASGGDLYNHLEECGHKTEHEARSMFRQMISALHHCHRKNIIHRDLKPENILLDEDLNVKVADFSFSRDFTNYKLTTVCGTFAYMALEILECQVYNGPKADVWSLGVILYRMLTGDELFVEDSKVTKIMKGMGFKEQEIQESLTQNKYDRVMGTYLILRRKTTKMQGRTIKPGLKL